MGIFSEINMEGPIDREQAADCRMEATSAGTEQHQEVSSEKTETEPFPKK